MPRWNQLKSEKEYDMACARIDALIDIPETDAVMNELSLVSIFVEEYEEAYYKMDDATPLDVIKFMMDMKGLKQKDLVGVLGVKSNVSRIMNGSRQITIDRVAELSEFLGVPIDALVPARNKDRSEVTTHSSMAASQG
jgi:HTH-type transcriptional regulator/antitoxin HigA